MTGRAGLIALPTTIEVAAVTQSPKPQKYYVRVARLRIETAIVEVEAATDEEAEQEAIYEAEALQSKAWSRQPFDTESYSPHVETMVAGLWPEQNHVVISLPDPRKGEQLVLVTDRPDADRAALLERAQAEGFPELWIPRSVLIVGAIPVLGSGKVDFVATQELARTNRAMM